MLLVVIEVVIREPVITIALSLHSTKNSRKRMRGIITCSEHEIYRRRDELGPVATMVPIHATAQRRPSAPIWKNLAR